ncbi:MAG: hypothetical protein CMH30_00960 [Micavibrio sp.]|nr:hypothetical protein [Micavibrio sp.]|tara:strand:+ start:883 stop:1218 length:336 start_codon:yes stop_codon:yes gene_type:complete
MAVSSSNSRDQKIFEIYTYCKDPERQTSPWHIFCTDVVETEARAKAHDLFKTRMFERIEIQQRDPSNINHSDRKLIKVYNKNHLSNTTSQQLIGYCAIALIVSFMITYFIL